MTPTTHAEPGRSTKQLSRRWFAAIALVCVVAVVPSMPGRAEEQGSPIFGVTIPTGYRQWELIAPSYETGLDELRVILGNPSAVQAYRNATLPFSDGTILAKLAWEHVPLTDIAGAFVPGSASTVQIMVKDATRYAATVAGDLADSATVSQWMKRSIGHASLATMPECEDTATSSLSLRREVRQQHAKVVNPAQRTIL